MTDSSTNTKDSIFGPIPKHWEVKTTGAICRSIVPGRDKPKVFDGDIPWITTPDISGRTISTSKNGLFVSREELKQCRGKTIPANSVVMSCVGDFGLVAIASRELVINQQLHAFVPDGKVDAPFLMYALTNQTKYMLRLATKTAVPYLNKDNCESIPIPLPPLPEQKKIAEILSCWDSAIETIEKLIDAKTRFKKGLIQRILDEKPDDDSKITFKFKEIAHINPSLSRKPKDNDLVSFVGMADVSERGTLDQHHSKKYQEVSKGFTSFQNDDVLVAKITPCFENGKGALAKDLIGGLGFGSTEFHVLRAKDQVDPRLLYYISVSEQFRRRGAANMTGSAGQKRIPKGFIQNYQISLPRMDEQVQICDLLDASSYEIETLRGLATLISSQKKGLMQQLLTGKVRVSTSTPSSQSSQEEYALNA